MRKSWTEKEVSVMLTMYPDHLTEDLLPFLPGRTVSKIIGKASLMGLKKSALFFSKPESGRISKINEIGVATRYQKNCAGWNKGMKREDYLSEAAIMKMKSSEFKKGQDPHNTVAIGSERMTVDGYVEVKVRHLKDGSGANKNFELKQRLIYEQHYGPISKDMIVEFKDRNKLNFDINNLELRTRRENLLANTMCDSSIVKRFLGVKDPELVEKIKKDHPDLIELKRTQLKLNKKIKENARKS